MKQVKKLPKLKKDGTPKLPGGIFGRFKTGQYKTPPGHSGFKSAYRKYKIGAGQRGLPFLLSEESFRSLVTASCHYCNAAPKMVSYCPKQRTDEAFERSKFTHNGIDRIDSALPYSDQNCVPCCTQCNRGKGVLSYDAFIEYLNNLTMFRGAKCPR